jgi:hypothetical protein
MHCSARLHGARRDERTSDDLFQSEDFGAAEVAQDSLLVACSDQRMDNDKCLEDDLLSKVGLKVASMRASGRTVEFGSLSFEAKALQTSWKAPSELKEAAMMGSMYLEKSERLGRNPGRSTRPHFGLWRCVLPSDSV